MKFKTIDNCLSEKDFSLIKSHLCNTSSFPWSLSLGVATLDDNHYYFIHEFFDNNTVSSNFFFLIEPLLKKISCRGLIRAKANLYPSTHELLHHGQHVDKDFKHQGAVFYVNSNDGYTILADQTKVTSIENRLLLFDSSTIHNSTTCTDQHFRVTININYFG